MAKKGRRILLFTVLSVRSIRIVSVGSREQDYKIFATVSKVFQESCGTCLPKTTIQLGRVSSTETKEFSVAVHESHNGVPHHTTQMRHERAGFCGLGQKQRMLSIWECLWMLQVSKSVEVVLAVPEDPARHQRQMRTLFPRHFP